MPCFSPVRDHHVIPRTCNMVRSAKPPTTSADARHFLRLAYALRLLAKLGSTPRPPERSIVRCARSHGDIQTLRACYLFASAVLQLRAQATW